MTPTFETVLFTTSDDHVATITLNRPEVLNAFNQQMCEEFAELWPIIRDDDAIRAVVLRAAGDRAFSTGVDVKVPIQYSTNVWSQADPGEWLSPKGNRVWKPVVCAVHGMAVGGAFYWINESDIVICSPEATFFDPHVTYGLTAVLEPIGLAHRVPLGEALRMALMGLDERISAERALAIGLVTEIVDRAALWERAHQIAAAIAAKPPAAVQGTVRAIWESLDVGRSAALARGLAYTQIGNPLSEDSVDRAAAARQEFRIR
jgi:enoyl-CoA hydratase/carnithine racemase